LLFGEELSQRLRAGYGLSHGGAFSVFFIDPEQT
jgi:hypothetical protein